VVFLGRHLSGTAARWAIVMLDSVRSDHPLRQLFAGLVENTFCSEVGLCDPALTDYIADLLVSFTHVDRLHAIRKAQGRDLSHVAAILVAMSDETPASEAERDRRIYREIGDFSLFWAGVYPEHLRQPARRASDVLVNYVTQGKRSYAIVSDLVEEDDRPPQSLFKHLSDEFESCLHGLGLVRRELEHQWPATPGELLI